MVSITERKIVHLRLNRHSGGAFSANPSLAPAKDHLSWLSAIWFNIHKSCSKKEVLPLAECVHEAKHTKKFPKQSTLYVRKGREPD